jgi:hypothetical protein
MKPKQSVAVSGRVLWELGEGREVRGERGCAEHCYQNDLALQS